MVLSVFGLLFLLAAVLPAEAAGACCAPREAASRVWPISVDPDSVTNWQQVRWAGADQLGGVYALGRRNAVGGGFEHFLVLSHDDGASWDPRTPLVLGAPGKLYARAAVSGDGQLLVVMSDGLEVSVIRSEDQGRSFAAPVVLGPIEDFGTPLIDLADDGRTLVTWREETATTHQVHAVASPDHGRSWGPDRVLAESAPNLGLTRPIPMVTTGAYLVAWSEQVDQGADPPLDQAFTRTSIDDGRSWSSPVQLSVPEDTTGWVALSTTELNEVQALYAVRLNEDEAEYRVTTSFNAGFSWSAMDETVAPTVRDGVVELSAWPDGSVWLVWFERDDPLVEDVGALVARRSSEHGRPGTWGPPQRFAEDGLEQHHVRLSQGPSGVVDLIHDDYRESLSCPYPEDVVTCESVYLDHSCDRGASWLPEELRLDTDAAPSSPHSEDPEIVRSPNGRLHVFFTNNAAGASGLEDELVHVALDAPGPTPEFTVSYTPPAGCAGSSHDFELVLSTVDWCADPSYQWHVDGAPVPGAVDDSFELPAGLIAGAREVHVELRCGGVVNCRLRSETVVVLVEPPLETQVEGRDIEGVLRVAKAEAELHLRWNDLSLAASGYNLVRGSLASLHVARSYDHESERCHLERAVGETQFELPVPRPAFDAYWIVSPADCAGEGLAGRDSFAVERPSGDCGPMPD